MMFRNIILMSFSLVFLLGEGYSAQQQTSKKGRGRGGQSVASGNKPIQTNQSTHSGENGGRNSGQNSMIQETLDQGVDDGDMQQDQPLEQQNIQPAQQQQSKKGRRGGGSNQQQATATHAGGGQPQGQQGKKGGRGRVAQQSVDMGGNAQGDEQLQNQHHDQPQDQLHDQSQDQQQIPAPQQNSRRGGGFGKTRQSAVVNPGNSQHQGMHHQNQHNGGTYGQAPISGAVGAVAVIPAPFLQAEDCNKCTRENCMSKQEGTEEADQAHRNALVCAEYCLHVPLKLFGCVSSAYKHFCKKQPKAVQQAGDCKKLMIASNEILQVVLENKDNLNSKLDAPYKGKTSYRDLAITQLTQAIKKPAADSKDPQNGNLTKLLETIKLGKTNKNPEKDKGALHGLTVAQRNLPEVLSASSREAKIFATFVSLANDMTIDVTPGGSSVNGVPGVSGIGVPQVSRGMSGKGRGKSVMPVTQQQATQQQSMQMQNPQAATTNMKTNMKANARAGMKNKMQQQGGMMNDVGAMNGDDGQW